MVLEYKTNLINNQ